jgi:hypothetical protein
VTQAIDVGDFHWQSGSVFLQQSTRGCKSGAVSGSEEGKADNEVDFWQAHQVCGSVSWYQPRLILDSMSGLQLIDLLINPFDVL